MRIIETSHIARIITRHASEVLFEAKDGVFQIIMTGK